MIIDPELFGLMIGKQRHTRKAGSPHAFNHGRRVRRRGLAPATSKLQRGGEQGHASKDRVHGGGFQ
jgi:hypothetical protein